MINILLVDDHDVVRAGIKKILAEVSGFRVVGEARTGEEAVQLIRKLHPHIVLMDVKMPGIGGFEATRKLLDLDADLKILMLTTCNNSLYPTHLLKLGASGYLTKESSIEEMIRAIRAVHTGQRYISPEIASKLVLNQIDNPNPDSPFSILSDRELAVMLMILQGVDITVIAQRLSLSRKTIHSHRTNIFGKLSVKNDVELTLLALKHDLIDLGHDPEE